MSELTALAAPSQAWLQEATVVASGLGTDLRRGLTSEEAAARLERVGPNRLDAAPPVPGWRRFLAEFADPLVYLLFVAVGISLVTWAVEGAHGAPFETIVILAIVLANAVLGYVQEARAEQAVAARQRMAAAASTVVRDGAERRIPATDVVPGDVLVVSDGDAVSVDARLIEAASLTVAEAALTGESEPVLKGPALLSGTVALGDRTNMVFSGTAVTRGRGRAVVTGTGMATEMGRIAGLLERTSEEATPLQREIARVGRILGAGVLVIAVVVMAAILLTSDIESTADVVDVLLVGVSLAVAAVPEGLPAVLSVVLALGVQRMARRHAIVKKLSSVETLGSASVICTDKTGTLTRNEMTIQTVVTQSGEVVVTGTGYRPEGEFLVDGQSLDEGPLWDEIQIVLAGGSLANDASLREEDGSWVVVGDPTEAAFLVAERKAGIRDARRARFTRVGEVPFTSERKLITSLERDAEYDEGLLTERVIDAEMQIGVVFVGLVMAVAALLTLDISLPGGLVDGSGSLAHARTMAVTTLVLAQLFNCFNARSDRVSAFHHLFTNRLLWAAIALSLALRVAVVHVPFLNDAFDTTGLDVTDRLLCVGMASTVLWADEIRKVVIRRR